ncbi:MAG TPA: Uma2 family endonuclease [Geminicoccaceae bacterium]|nr:Uma2 family endonuclease [Geminicoccaceae bacterium]
MAKAIPPTPRMTVEQFLAWLEDGPAGARYELVAGEVVAMAPERAAHARLKARIWRALDDQVVAHGLSCEALPDGMTVKIDEHTAYEPDAVVHCGARLVDDALLVPEPVIVVEVLSPTTKAHDAGAKLADYFRLPSVRHYLLVRTERPTVIHHQRGNDGSIATRIITTGALALDPPGLTLELAQIYG